MTVRIDLARAMFGERERPLASMGGFSLSTFRFDSGIEALRVRNRRGEILVLPFKGHQIWRAAFDGRDLTMKSMFDEPVPTTTYLETYGAFFIPKSFGSSITLTGGAETALYAFLAFYVTCLAVTWWFYTRRGGLLRDIERGGPSPSLRAPATQPAE